MEVEKRIVSIQMLIQGRELSLQQRGDAKQELENLLSQLEAKDKEKFNLSLQIKTLKGVKKRLNEKNTKLKADVKAKDKELKEARIEFNATYELLSKRTEENKELREKYENNNEKLCVECLKFECICN